MLSCRNRGPHREEKSESSDQADEDYNFSDDDSSESSEEMDATLILNHPVDDELVKKVEEKSQIPEMGPELYFSTVRVP